jgi:hypothetical protein
MCRWEVVVGLSGFEPLTSPLSGVRSNQLSYRPTPAVVYRIRIMTEEALGYKLRMRTE